MTTLRRVLFLLAVLAFSLIPAVVGCGRPDPVAPRDPDTAPTIVTTVSGGRGAEAPAGVVHRPGQPVDAPSRPG